MVEGHQCHRVAHAHRKTLVGRKFKATSPNGRFSDEAKLLSGTKLSKIEVHGKNLFYFFGSDYVVHIHFGMAGAFVTFASTSVTLPDPKPTTRLQLSTTMDSPGPPITAHLSAMTVRLGDLDYYSQAVSKLGQDPLRSDADESRVWSFIQQSKKPIGLVLMDQSIIAGIGNIYRAEILYKSRLHPEQPAHTISRDQWLTLWSHSVDLLKRGFTSGSIVTVDSEEALVLGAPWTRRYVYNHSSCGRCHSSIVTWSMANRTVYACARCQPLMNELGATRKAALAAAAVAQEFVSHCAAEDPLDVTPSKMTVTKLREALVGKGLSIKGRKAELVARLEEAALTSPETVMMIPTPAPAARRTQRVTFGDDTKEVASAAEAASEKLRAGEGRNIEHVALQDEETLALVSSKRVRRGSISSSSRRSASFQRQ